MKMGYQEIEEAHYRIKDEIHRTPLVRSEFLNDRLGHDLWFKLECSQKIRAFKARGALNAVRCLLEGGETPRRVIANSSGNHAQGVAWTAAIHGIPATIYMPEGVSQTKEQSTISHGAEVIKLPTRREVDEKVEEESKKDGVYWIPPYNHPNVIAGQGTCVKEAIEDGPEWDAMFAPCGGGGLLSGVEIAANHLSPKTKIYGVEPEIADDATRSFSEGKIQGFESSPDTIADGVRTLSVGDITFEYLKRLDGFYTVSEATIIYWTQWLTHLLDLRLEPTAALPMGGVIQWLHEQNERRTVLVMLTGGNFDQTTERKIWAIDHLSKKPELR